MHITSPVPLEQLVHYLKTKNILPFYTNETYQSLNYKRKMTVVPKMTTGNPTLSKEKEVLLWFLITLKLHNLYSTEWEHK
jgi:hypothetical protein